MSIGVEREAGSWGRVGVAVIYVCGDCSLEAEIIRSHGKHTHHATGRWADLFGRAAFRSTTKLRYCACQTFTRSVKPDRTDSQRPIALQGVIRPLSPPMLTGFPQRTFDRLRYSWFYRGFKRTPTMASYVVTTISGEAPFQIGSSIGLIGLDHTPNLSWSADNDRGALARAGSVGGATGGESGSPGGGYRWLRKTPGQLYSPERASYGHAFPPGSEKKKRKHGIAGRVRGK